MEMLKTKDAQKEFAESLVQHSAVPTFVLDNRHRVIIWDRACEELTGIKAADIIGANDQWKPVPGLRKSGDGPRTSVRGPFCLWWQ